MSPLPEEELNQESQVWRGLPAAATAILQTENYNNVANIQMDTQAAIQWQRGSLSCEDPGIVVRLIVQALGSR